MRAWRALRVRAREVPVSKFNRSCLVVAALWLGITAPLGLIWRPTYPDFSQFYMGGLVARMGAWHALYPIPRAGSQDNPGLSAHSYPKSGWEAIRHIHRVPSDTRFMLPPPSAFLFLPLTYVNLARAWWIWNAISIASVWGLALFAGWLYRSLAGRPTRWEGWIALLIVLSPMTARAIRIGNVSPQIAFLLSLALLTLVQRNSAERGARDSATDILPVAGAVLLGALLKYATLVFMPLLVGMRQWRLLIWTIALGALVLAITITRTGLEPFVEFYYVIMPTLSRPSAFPGNQSLPGLMVRVLGRPLPANISDLLSFLRLGTLTAILYFILRTRPLQWRDPSLILAGAALLIGWLLTFSPIAWEHWPIFLCPVWGWVLWEARTPGVNRVLALASLALMYVPAGIFPVSGFFTHMVIIPEPFNSWQLFGVMGLLALAFRRFATAGVNSSHPVPVREHFQKTNLKNKGINADRKANGDEQKAWPAAETLGQGMHHSDDSDDPADVHRKSVADHAPERRTGQTTH